MVWNASPGPVSSATVNRDGAFAGNSRCGAPLAVHAVRLGVPQVKGKAVAAIVAGRVAVAHVLGLRLAEGLMKRKPGKWTHAVQRMALVACIACGCAGSAFAAVTMLDGTPTTMQSNTERMISLRHQEHMWETSDGATHVIVNRGELTAGDSLQLYSTFDHGLTWVAGPRLSYSDRYSTSDGYLAGDILYLTHATPAGAIRFTRLQYVPGSGTWSQLSSELAYFGGDRAVAINPAMAVDALGTIWIAFVATDTATGNNYIKMLRSTTVPRVWADTGFVFGAVDNASIERSARPVATATGIGMVYTVHEKIYWASRENSWKPSTAWKRQQLFSSTASDNDPYASHFSVAADAARNIHMAISDGGRVGYFRFDAPSRVWSVKWLSNDINAGYIQTTVIDGSVVVAANYNSDVLVFRSVDGGGSFEVSHALVHPDPPSPDVSYQYPRIETTATTNGPMLLLQQYVDSDVQRLLLFNVPLP